MIPTSWPYPPQTYEAYAAIDRAGFTHYYRPLLLPHYYCRVSAHEQRPMAIKPARQNRVSETRDRSRLMCYSPLGRRRCPTPEDPDVARWPGGEPAADEVVV
jgi:hypothetical protein